MFAYAGRYRYTLDSPILSDDQRRFYEEKGFLVIPGLVDSEDLRVFRDRFQKLCEKEIKVGN